MSISYHLIVLGFRICSVLGILQLLLEVTPTSLIDSALNLIYVSSSLCTSSVNRDFILDFTVSSLSRLIIS
jgi:hypothetical protein